MADALPGVPLGWVSLLPMIVVAVATPIVLRLLPAGQPRRFAAAGLASIFLAHAGLYILWASRAACWILVGLSAVLATYAAAPHRRAPWIVAALAALALGVAFQLTPEDAGLILYVAGATPLLVGGSLALLASSALRRASSPRLVLSVAALAAFAGLIPFTSYWPTFLLTFEPMHLAPLALAIVGLALLAAARPPKVETLGDIAARPSVPVGLARGATLAGALLVVASALAGAGTVAPALAAAILAASLGALWGGPSRLAIVAGLALGLAGLASAEAALDLHLRGAGSAVPALRLVASSFGASLLAFALALALAASRDRHARDAALSTRGIPARAIVVDGEPTPEAVRALASQAGGRVGILRVVAPRDDPWWTLPRETYDALLATGVHAAIVEGSEVSIVPPLAEVDDA